MVIESNEATPIATIPVVKKVVVNWKSVIREKLPGWIDEYYGPVLSYLEKSSPKTYAIIDGTVSGGLPKCSKINKNDFIVIFGWNMSDEGRDVHSLVIELEEAGYKKVVDMKTQIENGIIALSKEV
jgi:hypothetical protein